MNRADTKAKIYQVLCYHDTNDTAELLTDLFIELSNERCQEQVQIIDTIYCDRSGEQFSPSMQFAIENAPLPEIN